MIKEMNTSSTKPYKNDVVEYSLRQYIEEIKRQKKRLNKLEKKVENYRLLARKGLIFAEPEKFKVKI